jgi:hypothetical protein
MVTQRLKSLPHDYSTTKVFQPLQRLRGLSDNQKNEQNASLHGAETFLKKKTTNNSSVIQINDLLLCIPKVHDHVKKALNWSIF